MTNPSPSPSPRPNIPQLPNSNPFFRARPIRKLDMVALEAGWDQMTEFITDTLSTLLSTHHKKLIAAGMTESLVCTLTLNMQEAWLSQFFVEGYAPDPTVPDDDDDDPFDEEDATC